MIQKSASVRGMAALAMTLTLAACGGGGDGGGTGSTTPVVPTVGFTESTQWTLTLPAAGASLCYDFNAKAEVPDCAGSAWDLKVSKSGSMVNFWTNSGSSGAGAGGAFGGPFDHSWAALKTWQNATTDPVAGAIPASVFFKDSASGVFSSSNAIASAAFEYGVGGSADHKLYPNYRTFVITSDSASDDTVGTVAAPVFALQITGYYGGAGGTTSGYPSLRWVDRSAPANVRTATLNASAGWVYYDLVAGAESSESGTWHIALNRYNVKLNGGASGTRKAAGFVAKTPDGFYDASGQPVAAKFADATNFASTANHLSAPDLALPEAANKWLKDAMSSPLQAAYKGSYPNAMNFGWYSYYPTAGAAAAAGLPAVAHVIKANSDNASLLRGGEGNTYARFHVAQIAYANPNDSSSQQTWTIEFDVQP